MVCDAETFYCWNAIPYLGAGSVPADIQVNQGEYFTHLLLQDLNVYGRVVCLDNWFTSLHLCETLREKGIYFVGTVKAKPDLPVQVNNM